jgi:immune inhibitor A
MLTLAHEPVRTALRVSALPVLAALALLTTGGVAEAVPVDPEQRVQLSQPDGTAFEARPFGDEWYHGFETPAGYTVVRDARSRTWEYAEPQGDELVPSGLVAGEDRPAGLDRHLRDPSRAAPQRDAAGDSPRPANVGTQPSLVILVQFADQRSLGTTPAQWNSRFFGASVLMH